MFENLDWKNYIGLAALIIFIVIILLLARRQKKKEERKTDDVVVPKDTTEPDWSKFKNLFGPESLKQTSKDPTASIKETLKQLDEDLKENVINTQKVLDNIQTIRNDLYKKMEVLYNMHQEMLDKEQILQANLRILLQNKPTQNE